MESLEYEVTNEMMLLRMLIVDDDDAFLHFMAAMIKTRYPSIEVQVAFDDKQALALTMSGEPPAVVITGIAKPRLDGNGLCKIMRERHGDRVKIIAMPITLLLVDAEFDRVLSKPFSIDALCAAIDALLVVPQCASAYA